MIGATSRPEYMDTTLRRAGRFDREISLKVPDEKGRLEILQCITKSMKILDKDSFMKELSRLTPGYVPADLFTLWKEASISAISRIYEQYFINEETKDEANIINNTQDNIWNQANENLENSEDKGEEWNQNMKEEKDTIHERLKSVCIEESDFMIAIK